MKRRIVKTKIAALCLAICSIAASRASGQMGLRENELFGPLAFSSAGPTIGAPAPKLDLKDLAGNSVGLESYRGKIVVLVKGGYT